MENLDIVLKNSVDKNFGQAVEDIFVAVFESTTKDAIQQLQNKVGANYMATNDGSNIVGLAARNNYGERSDNPQENELQDEVNRISENIAFNTNIEPDPPQLPSENDLSNLPPADPNNPPAPEQSPDDDIDDVPDMSLDEVNDSEPVFDDLSDDDIDNMFAEEGSGEA